MSRNINLTEGNIRLNITKLALPILGTSFIQMAYNLIDIMWLGRLSTNAVAAVGAAGFLLWLGQAFVMISQIGVGVNVAHCYGRGEYEEAKEFVSNGLQLDIIIAILYSIFLFVFRHQIIGFFNLDDPEVIAMAVSYLRIISIGIIFHFLNPVFSVSLNSSGNSLTPFKANTLGLVINIIADPILIFGLGPFPALGVEGAALATIFAQFCVTLIFIIIGKRYKTIFSNINIFKKPDIDKIKRITRLGIPPALQVGYHAIISMIITRLIANFGPVAVAVQSIGSQIESISWMSAEGFSSAISAFIGQNFGASKFQRIRQGYREGMQVIGGIGIFASLLMIFAAEPLFTFFLPDDPLAIQEGIKYLIILGFSQVFMSVEIGTNGAFNGLGMTIPPTINGMIFNTMRIPLAYGLSRTVLGLTGIWWAITGSSILKGLVIYIWFKWYLNKVLEQNMVLE